MQQIVQYSEGADGSPGLGFNALSVTIDNYSGSWAWIPGAGRYARPWIQGITWPVSGTSSGDVEWRVPQGIAPGPLGTGTLTAIWSTLPTTSSAASEGSGVGMFAQQSQGIPLATLHANVTNRLIQVPQGTVSLMVTSAKAGGPATLTIVGNGTGNTYGYGYAATGNYTIVFPIDPDDTVLTVTTGAGGSGVEVFLSAFPMLFSLPVPIVGTVGGVAVPVSMAAGDDYQAVTSPATNLLGAGAFNVGAGVTLFTIPAGRVWKGCLAVSVGAAGSANISQLGGGSVLGVNPNQSLSLGPIYLYGGLSGNAIAVGGGAGSGIYASAFGVLL